MYFCFPPPPPLIWLKVFGITFSNPTPPPHPRKKVISMITRIWKQSWRCPSVHKTREKVTWPIFRNLDPITSPHKDIHTQKKKLSSNHTFFLMISSAHKVFSLLPDRIKATRLFKYTEPMFLRQLIKEAALIPRFKQSYSGNQVNEAGVSWEF